MLERLGKGILVIIIFTAAGYGLHELMHPEKPNEYLRERKIQRQVIDSLQMQIAVKDVQLAAKEELLVELDDQDKERIREIAKLKKQRNEKDNDILVLDADSSIMLFTANTDSIW